MKKKGKDFLGKNITEVIEQACAEYSVSQEELDITVLETGSAGIFGLCKKQAHIRVALKRRAVSAEGKTRRDKAALSSSGADEKKEHAAEKRGEDNDVSPEPDSPVSETHGQSVSRNMPPVDKGQGNKNTGPGAVEEESVLVPPSQESLAIIEETLVRLLELMKCPATVKLVYNENSIVCDITSEYEDDLTGSEGRILDSIQYLLRKMLIRHFPERCLLSLNVGDFRQRRARALEQKAVELAEIVKQDGKTQAIAALNPSERRIVHMALQDDKNIRSRSVGDGLFKKVLIYKPGKSRRSGAKKKRG
ncbi:MAG: RNA-binding protein [Desulfobulbus propionicus]|nr:MAG: RNA-binding protein [Desulfobulbus propionicus]